MEPVYRLLGFSAAISERLSRIRGNGIPLNWLIILLVGVFACLALNEVRESLTNAAAPQAVALADVIRRADLEDRYVTTDGQFAPDAGLTMSRKGSEEPEKVYVPIVDVTTRSAVFVELDPAPNTKTDGLDAHHVTGMVRKLESNLKNQLGKTTQKVADIPIDTTRMIVAGQRPAQAGVWIPVAAAMWLLVLLLVVPILLRYVVFRRTPEPIETGVALQLTPAPASEVVRVTGKFSFGPKDRQRFHNMPAVIAELEGGLLGLVTQTDASVRFMGSVTQNRKGVWLIPIRPATLSQPEFGRYYARGSAHPAFRVRFTNDATNKPEWAILAFDSVAAMNRAREALYNPRPAPAPAPEPAPISA